jgi:L-lactate dehydrogenase (cytochrome)
LRNALDIATKPGWALGVLTAKSRAFGNLKPLAGSADLKSLSAWVANQFDPSITWKDVAWVRERWPGKLVLKGVLDADDARLAADQGADAVIVSNHGGRQLDGACSTIAALPEVVTAVGERCEVLLDGGVMSGQDVLKALALGARGCLIGKAYLYALAAQGQAGVAKAIEIIGNELKVSLALTGAIDVQNVSPSILR